MSLILATGSNIQDPLINLNLAREALSSQFEFIAASSVYRSEPVDYFEQPHFYNQVLEFKRPNLTPPDIHRALVYIEKSLGRVKTIPKGPRSIDVDLLFLGLETFQSAELQIPHPRWSERSFVVLPLKELPYYTVLKEHYDFPETFEHQSWKIN